MKKIVATLLLGIFLSQTVYAKTNVKVEKVVKTSFDAVSDIETKRLILTKEQHRKVQARARAKVDTKVYRYYVFKSGSKTVGYGVLISRKVRTKMATVLYGFTPAGTLKFSEIMAFGEPPEYIPNEIWMGQFKDKGRNTPLKMGKDIPTISGATLSARNISDGARIARALLEIAIRK
ncbi:FMN-binding protein [Sulfurovum sp. NBC37-1]|uniref:FMN-binding protein n=1 Tax=Sulfurovum sp. (strain NBC37-1) TaxID=387093 RepID=UPI0001587B7E|nr:FMN-binding protein [Sulfurovum sp. NBC37-1]BAF72810.1 conserved hypothetical protein [Sulfurovum sp. NBC37-1]